MNALSELKKEKIAVLAGGTSCEREISLISGRNVMEALTSRGLAPLWVDPAQEGFISVLRKEKVTLAFLALHGTFGEDGTAQALLEKEGILYTGPGRRPSELAFDKSQSQAIFKKQGICVPDFVSFSTAREALAQASFKMPWVVKPAKSGSSVGVTLVSKPQQYPFAVAEAFKYSDVILVEEFIRGRELTVGILGDQALPIVEVTAQREFYDYQAKYKDSGTRYQVPAELSAAEAEKVRSQALSAYRALECAMISRVDLILGADGRAYVLEINTLPGLTAKSLLPKAAFCAGIDFGSLCVKILGMTLTKRKTVTYG